MKIEKKFGPTTADVYFVDERNKKFPIKIAVECKDWSRPLTSRDIAEIDVLYRSSLSKGDIDYLWIISNHELDFRPLSILNEQSDVVYSTYEDFVSSIMNFSMILEDNILAFKNHDSSRNFLELDAKGHSVTLEQFVEDWLTTHARALIVYGGYGLGKTSFSLFMASKLTEQYRQGTFKRMPIRLSLSGLFTKQDLPALISTSLIGANGGASVSNFSYNLFLHMIREGHFVLILDGFDEMKHAMTAEEFAFNFEQMAPFFEGNSKTIILGRPDSFFTDEEEERILSGIFSEFDEPAGELNKVEISMLRRDQIVSYVRTRLSTLNDKNRDLGAIDTEQFLKRYVDTEEDVLSRPVQLNMFAKNIRRYMLQEGRLTRHRLYSDFIYEFVKREQSKGARRLDFDDQKLGQEDPRSKFMQNVAWWVLLEKRENRFTASELPRDVLPPQIIKSGSGRGVIREALVGSIIERISQSSEVVETKGGSVFYFPHKSYLEFLVAEYFCRRTFSRQRFSRFFKYANKEILSFINDGPAEGVKNIALGLETVRGPVLRELFRLASRDPKLLSHLGVREFVGLSSAQIFIYYEKLLRDGVSDDDVDTYILQVYKHSITSQKFYAAVQIACDHINRTLRQSLLEEIVRFSLNSVDIRSLSKMYTDGRNTFTIINDDAASLRLIFLATCVGVTAGIIHVNLRRVWGLANDIARSTFLVSEYELDQEGIVEYEFDSQVSPGLNADAKKLLSSLTVGRIPVRVLGPLESMFSRL
ncbi:NACHT domain-containing protein [Mesorhizobium sp. ORM6]